MSSPAHSAVSPRTADTPAGSIEYAVVGTGAPVLVLHGSPGGIDQAELMSRSLPRDSVGAVLVSRPGYLGTDLGACRTFDDEADLLVALLDQLGIQRAGVLCWSGSGPTAYRLAARHPDRVVSLVALDAVSHQIDPPNVDLTTRLLFGTRPGGWLLKMLAEHQPQAIISGTLSSEGSLTPDELTERTKQVFADETTRRFVLDLSATMQFGGRRKAGVRHDLELIASLPALGLESIRCPTLIVHGSADSDVPPEHGTSAAAHIPGAELLELERGTHLAFFVHPAAASAQARAVAYLRAV